MVYLIISSCSAAKNDSVQIPADFKVINPTYYLSQDLVSKVNSIRERVLQDSWARFGKNTTYAFDLYVRAGKAYKALFENNYDRVKSRILSSPDIEWFFISGGYGIIHSLEEARSYQATFNRTIARQNNIPFTANMWKSTLPLILDHIFLKLSPVWTYVFGSRDYTEFVKQTNFWNTRINVKMFESTGSSGSLWLSPILNDLLLSIMDSKVDDFNKKHGKFVKQGSCRN